jgi:hypothetical protein
MLGDDCDLSDLSAAAQLGVADWLTCPLATPHLELVLNRWSDTTF